MSLPDDKVQEMKRLIKVIRPSKAAPVAGRAEGDSSPLGTGGSPSVGRSELTPTPRDGVLRESYVWRGQLGSDFPIQSLAGREVSMTMTFNGDGTFGQTTIASDSPSFGKYTVDGNVVRIKFDEEREAPGGRVARILRRSGASLLDEDGKRWERQR